jgi:dTDP-4-amino-4,6-dideoxygalactose transaminase
MRTGQLAEITCLSFHPRKIITTGEGGMAITGNAAYAEKLRKLKKFGMATNGEAVFTGNGTNYKLSDVLASIGVKQMEKIEVIINRRRELAEYYDELLSQVDSVRPPEIRANAKHVYQTYAVYIEKEGIRDQLIAYLRGRSIETQIGTYALHLQPSYLRAKKVGKLERAEKLYRNLLALPMCHSMTRQDQERVVSEIKNFLTKRC